MDHELRLLPLYHSGWCSCQQRGHRRWRVVWHKLAVPCSSQHCSRPLIWLLLLLQAYPERLQLLTLLFAGALHSGGTAATHRRLAWLASIIQLKATQQLHWAVRGHGRPKLSSHGCCNRHAVRHASYITIWLRKLHSGMSRVCC